MVFITRVISAFDLFRREAIVDIRKPLFTNGNTFFYNFPTLFLKNGLRALFRLDYFAARLFVFKAESHSLSFSSLSELV